MGTLGIVVLGPLLAVVTFMVLGPFGWRASSPVLRLILLADFVYVLTIAALVLAQLGRELLN